MNQTKGIFHEAQSMRASSVSSVRQENSVLVQFGVPQDGKVFLTSWTHGLGSPRAQTPLHSTPSTESPGGERLLMSLMPVLRKW